MSIFGGIVAWIHRATAPRTPSTPLVWPPGVEDPELRRLLGKLSDAADSLVADDRSLVALRDLTTSLSELAPSLVAAREAMEAVHAASTEARSTPSLMAILDETEATWSVES